MSSKGKGKRLSKGQRMNIIEKLSKPNPPPKQSMAHEYDVREKAIRKTWDNQLKIEQQCSLMSEVTRSTMYQASAGRFTEVEDILYRWIDSMRGANLCVPPSLVISKEKNCTRAFNLRKCFKASWQWLHQFRVCKGLQTMLLHGEGGEVDKKNPELLAA